MTREWFRGCRRGYFGEYGMSALASLPPHRHKPFGSRNELNSSFSVCNTPSRSKTLWESSIHLHSVATSSSVESKVLSWLELLSPLNAFIALMTYAVTNQFPDRPVPEITNGNFDFSRNQIVSFSNQLIFQPVWSMPPQQAHV